MCYQLNETGNKMIDLMQTEYFNCTCYSPEHTISYTFDPEDGELYTSIYLYKWSFFKRLWIAIKYIFGYTSKFGDFDGGIVFRDDELERLKKLIDTVVQNRNERKEEEE